MVSFEVAPPAMVCLLQSQANRLDDTSIEVKRVCDWPLKGDSVRMTRLEEALRETKVEVVLVEKLHLLSLSASHGVVKQGGMSAEEERHGCPKLTAAAQLVGRSVRQHPSHRFHACEPNRRPRCELAAASHRPL